MLELELDQMQLQSRDCVFQGTKKKICHNKLLFGTENHFFYIITHVIISFIHFN